MDVKRLEELKLLPCYKCGGIATHSHYDKYPKGLEPLIIDGKIIREGKVWHFVNCEKCKEQRTSLHPKLSVEAIKDWNALPRALTWTTETPQNIGFYWLKGEDTRIRPRVVEVSILQDELCAFFCGNECEEILPIHHALWAGPIPMPKEPACQNT